MDWLSIGKPVLDIILWSSIILIFFLFLLRPHSVGLKKSTKTVQRRLIIIAMIFLSLAFPVREVITNTWMTLSLCDLSNTKIGSNASQQTGLFVSDPYGDHQEVLIRNKDWLSYVENIDMSSVRYDSDLYQEERERAQCLLIESACDRHPINKRYGVKYEWTGIVDGYFRHTKQEHRLSTHEIIRTTAEIPLEARKFSFSTTGVDIQIVEIKSGDIIARHRTYYSQLGFGCRNNLTSDFKEEPAEFISRVFTAREK